MVLFELLQLVGFFLDYLRVEYLWHAPIMPLTNRNGIRSWTSALRSSRKFLRCEYTFRATPDAPLVPLATKGAHSWLTTVATLANLERSLCAPSGMDFVHLEGDPT